MNTQRVCFTGAQGTGKTTILNMFKKRGENVITEVVRKLAKERGIKINKDGDDVTQNTIFNMYEEVLSQKEPYISDRSLIDVCSYSTYGAFDIYPAQVSEECALMQEERMFEWFDRNPDVKIVYFPIEFDVVDDGVRSTDEEYRADIDKIMKEEISELDLDEKHLLIVHGTPEERFAQICEFIGYDM